MERALLGVLILFVARGVSDPVEYNATPPKVADQTFLQKQIDTYFLFFHINEPIQDPKLQAIAESWDMERNIEQYKNVTALKIFLKIKEYDMLLPRSVPFNVLDPAQQFEAVTVFNVLYSSKDFDTLYKTAIYLRDKINEGLFVYVLSIVLIHHPETQDIVIPPIYEIFPSYFHNGQVMHIANRINTHGKRFIKNYPETYLWEDNVVIRWNTTTWPFLDENVPVSYYLNDYALNALYYNFHLTYPFWLSSKEAPLSKYMKGEYMWFFNKQFVNRYYLERLSNGLGEIPDLGLDVVPEGYISGLIYEGVPLAERSSFYALNQPKLIKNVERVKEIERRIRDAIEMGYFVDSKGEKINLRVPEAINVLSNVIVGNVDSPNLNYYGSIVTAWKQLLGNSVMPTYKYGNGQSPLIVPSPLDMYQTNLRDPAFYMIWKRILKLFSLWQNYLPEYKREDLELPSLKIQKIEVDKLITYYEHVLLNVTNALPMNEFESKVGRDQLSVLVQRPQLNHKVFKTRIHVKSDVPQTVVVRYFLAPKYDSKGFEIPLRENIDNFFQMDQYTYELPQGESVIERDSNGHMYMIEKWISGYDLYRKAYNALHGNGQFVIDTHNFFAGYPRRLMIPKGRIGGLPFHILVYINEYHAPQNPYGKGVNPEGTLGIGTGSRRMTHDPLRYPLDRPLQIWQIKNLPNLHMEEVQIFHKSTPDVIVPNSMFP